MIIAALRNYFRVAECMTLVWEGWQSCTTKGRE